MLDDMLDSGRISLVRVEGETGAERVDVSTRRGAPPS